MIEGQGCFEKKTILKKVCSYHSGIALSYDTGKDWILLRQTSYFLRVNVNLSYVSAHFKQFVNNFCKKVMFKSIQREISWDRYRFIVTIIARSLHDNGEIALKIPRNVCMQNFSSQSHKIVKARKYVVVNHFVNEAKPTDLKLVEEELPLLQNGGKKKRRQCPAVNPIYTVSIENL